MITCQENNGHKDESEDKSEISSLEVPPEVAKTPFGCLALVFHFIYSALGLILGFGAIILGIVLFIRGISGSSSWVFNALGIESNVTDAPPGVILFIVGLIIIIFTRFIIKSKK